MKDTDTGQPSAINIVEDIHVPNQLLTRAEAEFIVTETPLTMVFTVDWRWPQECAKESTSFRLLWFTPSGNSYEAVDDMEPGIAPPTDGNRKHIEVALEGVPVEQEGIYHFEIQLNGISRYKYPIRVRPQSEQREVTSTKAPRKRARRSTTEKGASKA